MKVILTPNPDPPFNLRRIHLAYEDRIFQGIDQEAILEFTILRNKDSGYISPANEYWVVDEAELPGGSISDDNDIFFDAWEWTGKATVNMPNARGIQMNLIRAVRNKELAKADNELEKAIDDADSAGEQLVRAKRQFLRNIPQTFDLNTPNDTPEELAARWPDGLARA